MNTLDKLRALSAKWLREADEAAERANSVSAACGLTLVRCASELDAILAQSETERECVHCGCAEHEGSCSDALAARDAQEAGHG